MYKRQATTGDYNTAVGSLSMRNLTSGSGNVGIGYSGLATITTGTNNTGVGPAAGSAVTSGGNNFFVGHASGTSSAPGGAVTTGNNEGTLGNSDISKINVQCSLTVASDQRDKTDFTALDLGLAFVNQLQPVTYKWDKRAKYVDWKSTPNQDLNSITHDGTHKESWLDVGFKAQEVNALEEAAGYTIASEKNLTVSLSSDGKQYGMQYEKFVPILVKALQEADDKIDALTARIETLEG